MQGLRFFQILRFSALFFICCAWSLCGAEKMPALSISTLRITGGGNAVSLPPRSGVYCEFILVNRTNRDETVRISIHSAEQGKDADRDACFRADVFSPACSEQRCRIPFQLDQTRNYRLGVSPRRVSVPAPELYSMFSRNDERLYALLTDSRTLIGTFSGIRAFRGKALVYPMRASEIPQHGHVLESFDAVLLDRTDFSAWSSFSFDAVVEYVQNGGTLCFPCGETALAAAETPLAALLPVVPVALSREYSFPEILKRSGGYFAYPFSALPFVISKMRPGAETVLSGNGFPLFAEWKYGKGTVRFSAVDLASPALRECRGGEAWAALLIPFFQGEKIPPRKLRYTAPRIHSSFWKISASSAQSMFAVLAGIVLFLLAVIVAVRSFVKKRFVAWGISGVCYFFLILTCLLILYLFQLLPGCAEHVLERFVTIEITEGK